MNPIIQGIINTAVPMVMPILSIVLVYILKYISQKTKNEQAEAALTRITNTVETIVANYFANAVKTGKLDDQAFKTNVFNAVMGQLPEPIQKASTLGINSLSQFVSHKIEGSLLNLKAKYPGIQFNPAPAPTEQPSDKPSESSGSAIDTVKSALEDLSKVIMTAMNQNSSETPKEA